ncbi:MAG: hypothetical protein M1818_006702 [Claussenomyces sp. TS43310]|nr:MAG: hypothetical protein M1818_006702 [Claussenomyces sp. TS43310]
MPHMLSKSTTLEAPLNYPIAVGRRSSLQIGMGGKGMASGGDVAAKTFRFPRQRKPRMRIPGLQPLSIPADEKRRPAKPTVKKSPLVSVSNEPHPGEPIVIESDEEYFTPRTSPARDSATCSPSDDLTPEKETCFPPVGGGDSTKGEEYFHALERVASVESTLVDAQSMRSFATMATGLTATTEVVSPIMDLYGWEGKYEKEHAKMLKPRYKERSATSKSLLYRVLNNHPRH